MAATDREFPMFTGISRVSNCASCDRCATMGAKLKDDSAMQPLNRTPSSQGKPMLSVSGANPRSPAVPNRRLLKIGEVCAVVGVSRAMIYKSMRRRSAPFPRPVKIGAVSRWPVEDVEAWVSELRAARGRSRQAVQRL